MPITPRWCASLGVNGHIRQTYSGDGDGSMSVNKKELIEMIALLESAAGLAPMPKRDHALCQQAAEALRKFIEDLKLDAEKDK